MPGPLGIPMLPALARKPAGGPGPLGRIKPVPLTPYDEADEVARFRESIGLPPEPPIKKRPAVVAAAPPAQPATPTPPAEKKWGDPARTAERARRRAEWAEERIKNIEKDYARRRATEAAYQKVINRP